MKRADKVQMALIAVGKLRHDNWKSAQADYLQRLQRYTGFRLVEVKDAVGRGYPDAVAVEREGSLLLEASTDFNRRILLTADGKQMSSTKLAAFLQTQRETYGRIAFLIGGPIGFSTEVQDCVDYRLSLSRLTFPHELARVILLEQLYRAFTILQGEKYHK